jgi:photosystem II stability/assembly factor-like uncharacterized protein
MSDSARSLLCLTFAGATLATAAAAAEWRVDGPDFGTVLDLAVDPLAPDTVYAATANGGVFRSDDFGGAWSLPGTDLTGRQLVWIEADPGTPGTVWAGEKNPGEPALWRSRDRGGSWKRVTDAYRGELHALHPVGYRIAFAPSKPSDVWVPSTNLHYRSRDGGKTWSDFRVPGDAYAVAVDPHDATVVYAAGHGGEASHLFRSTDAGKSWKPAGTGLEGGIRVLAVDPTDPNVLFAATGSSKLFKSRDRGATFAPLALPAGATDEVFRLQFEPPSDASGARKIWVTTEQDLFESDDGGATWRQADRGLPWVARALAFDARTPGRMLLASAGGGVYATADGGATWRPSSAGLAVAWVEDLWGAPEVPGVFAGTTAGLFRRDGSSWTEVRAPLDDEPVKLDGMAFDPRSRATLYAFLGTRGFRSTDGGRSFRALEIPQPSMRQMMKGEIETAEFRSLTPDAGDSKTLYAGSWSADTPGTAVFRTTDAGKSWSRAGQGIEGETVGALVAAAPKVVLAVVEEHRLFRTTDGAATWSRAGSGLPDLEIRRLAVDPANPARAYVATEKGLWASADQGATFAPAGAPLDAEDVEAVAVAPDGRVFAGSFGGVFASADGGATWKPLDGLRHTDVRALAIGGVPLRLWAGTAGGGVYSIELP